MMLAILAILSEDCGARSFSRSRPAYSSRSARYSAHISSCSAQYCSDDAALPGDAVAAAQRDKVSVPTVSKKGTPRRSISMRDRLQHPWVFGRYTSDARREAASDEKHLLWFELWMSRDLDPPLGMHAWRPALNSAVNKEGMAKTMMTS